MQIFRASWVHDPDRDGYARVTMNGRMVGPSVHVDEVEVILSWFTGYMTERVADAARSMGVDVGAIQTEQHRVPAGRCPSCGKGPGVIADRVENPCPVCRQ